MDEPQRIVQDLLFKEECYQIIGICMKIHSILGKGFKEVVYKDAMEVEFKKVNMRYKREQRFNIQYTDVTLAHKFDADFFVFDSIILEVKAVCELRTDNFKQTLNYLKASEVKLGILINFGEDKLKFRRVICSY
jgi:GxxExxY protein